MGITSSFASNRFLQSSFIVIAGSAIVNAFNYAFNLATGRMLSPLEYGEVVTLVTLFTITGVASATLTTLLAQRAAHYASRGEMAYVAIIFKSATKYGFSTGVVIFIAFLALTPILSGYLKISYGPLYVFGLLMVVSLLAATGRGILQGLQRFRSFAVLGIIETVGKLAFAIAFILLGFSVGGVVFSIALGLFASYLYSLYQLKKMESLRQPEKQVSGGTDSILGSLPPYTVPIAISTLLLAVFANVDVIMAKHYLNAEDAGMYAALAVIGRTVTYGSAAIVSVMFPMATASFSTGDGRQNKFLAASLAMVAITSLVLVGIFIIAPEWTVTALLGTKYAGIAPHLRNIGIALSLAALAKVFIFFFMAAKKTLFLYPFIFATALQIALMAVYHGNIGNFVNILLATSALLLVCVALLFLADIFFRKPLSN